jgi:hypothetical protein
MGKLILFINMGKGFQRRQRNELLKTGLICPGFFTGSRLF